MSYATLDDLEQYMRGTTVDARSKKYSPPMCARCLKQCDRLEESYDPFMSRIVYTAVCHGERERVIVTEEEMNMIDGQIGISMGWAFNGTRALPVAT